MDKEPSKRKKEIESERDMRKKEKERGPKKDECGNMGC